MFDSKPSIRRPTSTEGIKKCVCSNCSDTRLTVPGARCSCGSVYTACETETSMRKAYGAEDTDLRKA